MDRDRKTDEIIASWPEDSREAAQLVIDAYRRKVPTPCKNRLRVPRTEEPADVDEPLITQDELRAAAQEGRKKAA